MPRFIALVAVASLLVMRGQAQEERAVVTGVITDPAKSAIPGATIAIDSKATGFHRIAATNESGSYLIPGLPVGVYDLTISKEGFTTEAYNSMELVVGQIRTINSEMHIASSSQEVKVEAETPALAQSEAKVGGVLESDQVANLPLNGRAWTSLMALVPGASTAAAARRKRSVSPAAAPMTTTSASTASMQLQSRTRPRTPVSGCRSPPNRSPNSKSIRRCSAPIRGERRVARSR